MSFHSPAPLDLLCTNFFIANYSQTEAIIINSFKQIDLAPIICKYIKVIFGKYGVFFFKKIKYIYLHKKGNNQEFRP